MHRAIMRKNEYLQERDRGAVVKSNFGVRHCKAVAVVKGAAAEGGAGILHLGKRRTFV